MTCCLSSKVGKQRHFTTLVVNYTSTDDMIQAAAASNGLMLKEPEVIVLAIVRQFHSFS